MVRVLREFDLSRSNLLIVLLSSFWLWARHLLLLLRLHQRRLVLLLARGDLDLFDVGV